MLEEIINTCEPLIKSIAQKFYGADYEDLYQVGRIGVIEAYNHYKDDTKTKFTTFAYQYIFGQMYQYTMLNKTIKQNRDTLKLVKLIDKTKNYLEQSLNRLPTMKEISTYLNIHEQTLINSILNTHSILSLDKEMDCDTNLYNTIKTNNINEDYIDLTNTLNSLSKDEQELIRLRYFEDLTQSETASYLGINQVKVSREEKRVLKKMRTSLNYE